MFNRAQPAKSGPGLRSVLVFAALICASITSAAKATWSIILVNVRTGEVAAGSATCLTGFDLKANTPVLLTGIGAVTAQSFVDTTGQNRVFARDQLLLGTDPQEILNRLAQFDSGHQTRQYGIVDTLGRAATFSGAQASQWKGGVTGSFMSPEGEIAYAIQGNILTGAPVVLEAEQAVINTPGDLAEKMMAGMEAARVFGGDGRCSCPGNPTGCGAPPPNFTKSAHIAYMLIARAGDENGCNGIYRITIPAYRVASIDFTSDGLNDVATISSSQPQVSILINQSQIGGMIVMDQFYTVPIDGPARALAVGNVNGDTHPDIVVGQSTMNTVGVLLGQGNGQFNPVVSYPTGTDPQQIAIADLDGINGADIITGEASGQTISVLLADGMGGFGAPVTIPAGGRVAGLVTGDADGDLDVDVIIAESTTNMLKIFENDGSGALSLAQQEAIGGAANGLAAAHFNGDTTLDYAVSSSSQRVLNVLVSDGMGGFTRTDLDPGARPLSVTAGDVNQDGNVDLVTSLAVNNAPELITYRGDGAGAFASENPSFTGFLPVQFTLADLNGDTKPDFLGGGIQAQAAVIVRNKGVPGGAVRFNDGEGCATGDWYMDFNVANTTGNDPDPVFTLRDMFDDWRDDLVGRPDATTSLVTIDPPVIRAGVVPPGETATIEFELLDWQGAPITAPISAIDVTHASGGLTTIGAVTNLGGGRYSVDVTAGTETGVDTFNITIDDGERPVTLMPNPRIEITCYADCDQASGGVGNLDIFDFLCFQDQFVTGDLRACLCNGDPQCDIFDFLCFQDAFVNGCD